MKKILRHIISKTYQPLLKSYLAKTRKYSYEGVKITVPPSVFHPGFFFSTHFLWQQISKADIKGKTFLELGCGSGLISVLAAQKGAAVTASDINPDAVSCTKNNAGINNKEVTALLSDIFEKIPSQPFDIIAINPPYYKKPPANLKEHAWYCGANGEYFQKLFLQLGGYIHPHSTVLMVLCEGCDIKMITEFAAVNGFELKLEQQKNKQLEENYIYSIIKH